MLHLIYSSGSGVTGIAIPYDEVLVQQWLMYFAKRQQQAWLMREKEHVGYVHHVLGQQWETWYDPLLFESTKEVAYESTFRVEW